MLKIAQKTKVHRVLSTRTLVLVIVAGTVAIALAAAPYLQSFDVFDAGGGSGTPAANTNCQRPYASASPWNTPIDALPNIDPTSASFIGALHNDVFGSDPTQYTYPVYEVTNVTPLKPVAYSGYFANIINNGQTRQSPSPTSPVYVPIPNGATPSVGTDGQIIIINRDTGDEWGFWRAVPQPDGTWTATNGYHYNTQWSGVPPAGFTSRGAGVSYLAGLIRKCEIEQGNIDHALAFAYDSPCSAATCAVQQLPYFTPPATKSDGSGIEAFDFPEGTRLQLDPNATATQIATWCPNDSTTGYTAMACRAIVRALQVYGMFTIDHAGHPKIYAEDNLTAQWGGLLNAKTVKNIPYSAFRVIAIPRAN